jgi:hypothetical protein
MSNVAQRSFAGGEIAPALYTRTDLTKYATGLRQLRNMIVQRHGGATNRAGTPFLNEVKDSTKVARLVKYVYNASQTYVLEFGDFYMRVFKLGARVSVAGVAAWNGATAYVVGDLALSGGINYYCVQAHTNHVPPNATYGTRSRARSTRSRRHTRRQTWQRSTSCSRPTSSRSCIRRTRRRN